MAIDSMAAAKAYLNTAKTLSQPSGDTAEVSSAGAAFGNLVGKALETVEGSGNTVETAMIQTANGKTDLVDVVTAVAAAEATLETVVSVRDQVIKAYQDIMRMPI